jgi:hypothetical protein
LAAFVKDTEVKLRRIETPSAALRNHSIALRVVPRDASAAPVHKTEVKRRFDRPSVRRFAKPLNRLCVVLRYASAVSVHNAEVVLSLDGVLVAPSRSQSLRDNNR